MCKRKKGIPVTEPNCLRTPTDLHISAKAPEDNALAIVAERIAAKTKTPTLLRPQNYFRMIRSLSVGFFLLYSTRYMRYI